MPKIAADLRSFFPETMAALSDPGCLLVSQGKAGKPNAMTIGWATFGIIWGRPICTVLVRPSRYTWTLLEESDEFTVNVPPPSLAKAVTFCGTQSGRDRDKFAEMHLTAAPGQHVRVPLIEQCVIHYECRIVHRNNVVPEALAQEVTRDCYPKGDFHTLYYGLILGVTADEDAREKLRG